MSSDSLLAKDIRPNGFYFNLLFILYYLLLAPLVNKYIMFGEKNIFVALLGIVVYVTEFFAFNFKMRMIRLRAYAEKLRIKKETGKEIELPAAGCILNYAVVIRFLFRIGFIMVAMMAFSFDPSQENSNPVFIMPLVTVILLEVGVLGYTFSQSGMLDGISSDEKDKKEWLEKYFPKFGTGEYKQKEFLSDIVLHLYAFMLITAFWNPINESGQGIINQTAPLENSAFFTGIILFFMYLVIAFISLPAIRLAYWVEESSMALTSRDKWKLRGSFLLTAAVVASPVIQEYFKVFFWK